MNKAIKNGHCKWIDKVNNQIIEIRHKIGVLCTTGIRFRDGQERSDAQQVEEQARMRTGRWHIQAFR